MQEFSIVARSHADELDGVSLSVLLGNSRGFLINRLLHLWGEFCRGVVVASSLGGYSTLSGQRLRNAPQIGSLSDILRVIKEPRISGPGLKWEDPSWTVRKISRIRPANLQQINLGVAGAPYDEFRRVRNYVIHNNYHTRSQFDILSSKYSMIGVDVDDLLLSRLPGGATVFEAWVTDFQTAAMTTVT